VHERVTIREMRSTAMLMSSNSRSPLRGGELMMGPNGVISVRRSSPASTRGHGMVRKEKRGKSRMVQGRRYDLLGPVRGGNPRLVP